MKIEVIYCVYKTDHDSDDGGDFDDFEKKGEKNFRIGEDEKALAVIQEVVDTWEDSGKATIDQGGDDETYDLDFPTCFLNTERDEAQKLALQLLNEVEAALNLAGFEVGEDEDE